jgi:hypothetical protein
VSELFEHFKQGEYHKLFRGEYTNATRFLYTALLSAVVDNADTIVIKQNHFEWYQADKLIGTYWGVNSPVPVPTFNLIIYQVFTYDELVRKYMKVSHADTEKTVLEITNA